ncbi:probable LRR receptor-like serine/threonine-protein kinase At1g53440 isoform X1 [Typha latifolia]|uniref:probable LRR receptor-like serine/threonine-protein kinase At1g53440 isoform X1 n=1 Tax=Typha latifolia TaxID=4733 RepID=UPI003C2EE1F9
MRAFTWVEGISHVQAPQRLITLFFLLLLGLSGSLDLRCGAQKLPQDEVNALKVIGSELGKNWNFSVNPCDGAGGWFDPQGLNRDITNNLTCHCNTTSNVCHVISIWLKGQNLTGILPDELANLTFLSSIDFSRNYLNGSIPTKWASLPLTHLSLQGNRISGSIPEEIGSITALQNISLEGNQLQGPIPASLGNLLNLNRLFLSANNLSGELPDSLGKLKNLTDFRIDGNPITGKIPSFFGNWTKLQRDMQGTSMEGPFPAVFSTLSSLTDLRITDLKGDGKFPPLQKMKKMKELVLRNVSISGELPDFLGDMTKLKVLDLSFNNLTGPIPSSYDGLANSIDFMYFTNNKLKGTIPNWILRSGKYLDLSFNSFTGSPSSCQLGNVNLFSSYSTADKNSISGCLMRNSLCGQKAKNYKFFINCGGSKVIIGDEVYEVDTSPLGASRFQLSDSMKWGYSSTGDFIGNEKEPYITTNASVLNMDNPKLYTTARLSPLSLKYYGFCLQKGVYTVNLHFAEIMFTDDDTYASVGTRLFDVSIQGQKVLQNFNIAKEANGTGKAIIKSFNASVDGTLEIHFQWTGKGTNSIPHRSVYGPLISAISVTPNFTPEIDGKKLSVGAIVGIASGCTVILVTVLVLLLFYLRRKDTTDNELRGLELQAGYFSLRQIKTATKNFDPTNKIGEGGFGPVYRGVLSDGSVIAVKQLSSKSRQGNREFVNEIGMISALQHPNLVKLFGCCIEGNQLLLIYEYMENNSLARALFGPEEYRLKLDWETRRKICLGIARGLAYLHEESRLKIVHRDIKATNILLDKELNAKISDFGLAKLDEEENTHISTRIAGTIGYMAPEYAMRGYLTYKADVYSFGVVTLEIVSGMSNTNYRPKEDCVYLLDWAYVLQEQGNLLELVDPTLGSNFSKEEALQMLSLALVCTNPSPTLRPMMSSVVSMLDGKMPVEIPSVKHTASKNDGLRFKSFENMYHESETHSVSTDGPWADSSGYSGSSKDVSAAYLFQQVDRSNSNMNM